MRFMYIFLLVLLFIIPLTYSKSLTVTPSAISLEYTQEGTQPSEQSITFTNSDNTSFSISLTRNGTGTDFYNISTTTLGFNETESKVVILKFGIQSDAESKLYSSNIIYGNTSEFIPIFINVKTKTTTSTGCKVLIPGDFSRSIKKGTKSFTEDFSIQISSKCINGLKITGVKEGGQVTVTDDGLQPIKLTGVIPKGTFEKGQSISFTVEFDVSQLSLGEYKSSIIFTATEGDEQFIEKMDFRIFVVGTATALSNATFTSLPTCSPQTTDLQVGKTYTLICNNVQDANIKLNVVDDTLEYLKGISYDSPSNQIIWSFSPIKMGNTKLKTYFSYNNLPIGELQEFDLRIGQLLPGEIGTQLIFDFFPKSLSIDNLKEGDTFSVLIKAVNPSTNNSGIIIPEAVLYKDGQKSDVNTFTVKSGETFTLSASAQGFGSIDKTISIPLNILSLSLPEIEQDVPFSINVAPSDAIIKVDGVQVNPNNITLTEIKQYTLTAEKQGYSTKTIQFQSTPNLKLLNPDTIPEKLKLDEQFTLEYNKPVYWYVMFNQGDNSSDVLFTQSTSTTLTFLPKDKGIYRLFVRDKKIAEYDKTGYDYLKILLWAGAIVVIIIILTAIFRNRGGSVEEGPSIKYTPD